MGDVEQIIGVDDIANSSQELENKVLELVRYTQIVLRKKFLTPQTGIKVQLDDTETVGIDFQSVHQSIPAVLVRKNSSGGAVFITGPGTPQPDRVRTDPTHKGYDILIIKEKQTCSFLGAPSVRYFRPRS